MTILNTLRDNLSHLSERDQTFAKSLLQQSETRPLSSRQMYWVEVLAGRATTPASVDLSAVTVGDMAPVVALLNRAGQSLKRPKLRLMTADGRHLRLAILGPTSRNPGHIAVSGDYEGIYYGRIDPAGAFHPKAGRDAATMTAIVTVLKAMATDPVGTATAYGRLTGRCCFCALPLSDPQSTAVGYGPICAGHFGLPWGSH